MIRYEKKTLSSMSSLIYGLLSSRLRDDPRRFPELISSDSFSIQGSVAFSEETGDRIAWTKIEQLQRGKYEVVAFYDQKSDNLTW